MKRIFTISLAVCALFATACNKESAPKTDSSIKMTLNVSAPADTRTELGGDGVSIVWQSGDAIAVFGEKTSAPYTFTLTSGAGESTAVFEGEIDPLDASDTFYAVYPAVGVRPASLASGKIEIDKNLGAVQTAVKDSYDPNFAVLTGVVSDSQITFRHGMAYFKLTVGTDGVYSIKLSSSKTRFQGRPVFNLDGSFSAIESAQPDITLKPSSGTFENGATYYIPVPVRDENVNTLTLEYTFDEDGTMKESLSTEKTTKLSIGTVYNLGTPNITYDPNPVLNVTTTTVNAIAPEAASGLTIENAYTTKNCTDGDIQVSFDGTVVTEASVANGTVTYSISENTTEASREGWIKLGLSGAEASTITVSQRAPGASIDWVWDFSEWQEALQESAPGAKGQNVSGWTVSVNGLTYTSGGSNGKWDSDSDGDFIQPNGGGSQTVRVFSFEAPENGRVTVTAKSASSGNSRDVNVLDSSNSVQSQSVDAKTEVEFSVAAGTVYIYPGAGIRFYKIEYHSN